MSETLLSARNVSKSYAMGKRVLEVLRGVSLDVARGEFLALRGASGAGKSTLLHLFGGLDSPNGGEIWFAGKNLAHSSENDLASVRRVESTEQVKQRALACTRRAAQREELATRHIERHAAQHFQHAFAHRVRL